MKTISGFRVVVAAAVAFAPPAIAAAQVGPPVSASPAIAPAVATPGTITVAGRGTSSVPPDRLRVVVRLTPHAVTGDQLEALAASVAAAMQKGGIADAKVVLPIAGFIGSNSSVAVVGTIANPTRESVEAIARATLRAIPDSTALALQNGYQIQGSYTATDCSAGDTRAQASAIADARARAERVAAASGLRLGPILSVNEGTSFGTSACVPDENAVTTFGANQDPYGTIAIPISVSATVVFGVR